MFDCESDLLDRALDRFVGPVRRGALPGGDEPQVPNDAAAFALVSVEPSEAVRIDAARRGFTHVHRWGVLPSRKIPRWMLPVGNRSAAMAATRIYEPLARTTRIMKSLVIRGMQMGWKSWARHEVLIASRGPLPLELLVRQVTGEPHPMFALSVGNQRTMRKLTVLAMRPDGEILGYMKLPLTDAATQRVRNEAAILQRLWNYPALRPHLPRILYAGSYNESYLLFQSPSMGPLGPTGLVGIHEKFLQVLWGVHRAERPGKLLIEEVALQWEQCAAQRENEWEELGQEVLRRSTRALGQVTIPSGVMHGDFAPWNTRVEHGRLFLFDWESAAWEAPIAWDIFHFQVQTACFLKKGRGFSGRQWEGTEEMSFLLYLLSSAAQLIAEGADRTGINYRRELLTKCLSEKTSQEAVGVPAGRKRWDSAITKGLYD